MAGREWVLGVAGSVDLEDAEDVRRGRGLPVGVELEGGAGDGLQLRPLVQAQQA